MTTIKAKIELEHGSLLTAANAQHLCARRPAGYHTPNPKGPEIWRCEETAGGFIFRSELTGWGICGAHPNVRSLVIQTLLGFGLESEFEVFYDRPEVPV